MTLDVRSRDDGGIVPSETEQELNLQERHSNDGSTPEDNPPQPALHQQLLRSGGRPQLRRSDGSGTSSVTGLVESLIHAQKMLDQEIYATLSVDDRKDYDELSTLGGASIVSLDESAHGLESLPIHSTGESNRKSNPTNHRALEEPGQRQPPPLHHVLNQQRLASTRRNDGAGSSSVTGLIVDALIEAQSIMNKDTPGASVADEKEEVSTLGSISSEVKRLDALSKELRNHLFQVEQDFQNIRERRAAAGEGNGGTASRRSSELSLLKELVEEESRRIEALPSSTQKEVTPSADNHASKERSAVKGMSELSVLSDFLEENSKHIWVNRDIPEMSGPLHKRCESSSTLGSEMLEDYPAWQHSAYQDGNESLIGNDSLIGNESLVHTIVEEDSEHSDMADDRTTGTFATLLEELDDPHTESTPSSTNNDYNRDMNGSGRRFCARSLSLRTATGTLASSSQVVTMHNKQGPARILPRFLRNRFQRVNDTKALAVGVPILGSASDGRRMMFMMNPALPSQK